MGLKIKEVIHKLKTMDELKRRELALAKFISKSLSLIEKLETYVKEYCKKAIVKLQEEISDQYLIRENRLEYLALEQEKIKRELEELQAAHGQYSENLAKM
jgi:hypothetical protein